MSPPKKPGEADQTEEKETTANAEEAEAGDATAVEDADAGEAPWAGGDDAPDTEPEDAADEDEADEEPAQEEEPAEEADAAPAEEAVQEDEAAQEEDAAEGDEPAAKRGRRRRGSAETGAGARRQASRRPEGDVVVRARAKYVRSAPRKARLVMDHIRGRDVEQARAMLTHGPRAVSVDILKLLDSAVANAESNYELGADELRIVRAFVDEGPTIKRYRPRALGRATRILKRTSHMTIELTNGTR
jgi:ribosomal protein L22